MPENIAHQLAEVGLLPPWVIPHDERDEWSGQMPWYEDSRLHIFDLVGMHWLPLGDYEYAFWLFDKFDMGKFGFPLHTNYDDIPRAIIKAALVYTLAPVVVTKKE